MNIYDDIYDYEPRVDDPRFRSREEDPIGDWEHSPDGRILLVWKRPSQWPEWIRWAKRLASKFGEPIEKTALLARVVGKLWPQDEKIKKWWEEVIPNLCPACGLEGCQEHPQGSEHPVWSSLRFDRAIDLALKYEREVLRLEPSRPEPEEEKEEDWGPDGWVPLPLVPEEEEEETPAERLETSLLKLIKSKKSVSSLSSLGKWLYKISPSLSKDVRDRVFRAYKARKEKLSLYRQLAERGILRAVLDARDKILDGGNPRALAERLQVWGQKLPEEVREETISYLQGFLPPSVR